MSQLERTGEKIGTIISWVLFGMIIVTLVVLFIKFIVWLAKV